MQTSRCSLCNSDIIVEDEAYEGDMVECSNCGAELEIVSLHPVQLAVIDPENEDDLEEDELE